MVEAMLDNPIFCGLAVLFTLLFLVNIGSFIKIFPVMTASVWRWKNDLELEDSLQLSRSRNTVAAVLLVPLCMVVYSYDLYSPDFLDRFSPILRFAAVTGVMFLYLLLRAFLNWQLEMHNYGSKAFVAANRSFFNYCIMLFFLLFLTGAAVNALTGDAERTRTVLLYVTGVSYVFYIMRRGQIFASACNPFSTFLYLCGLELIPTLALVISARLL
ncbi:MAG: DUF4271 domain-containing protein [Bacteroidales bacterium]|nr:DUF4271 domain-containing protein [Bacteroidales bacterium]